MKKLALLLFLLPCGLMAQTCTPGGGVTCSPNLNLWILPQHYNRWDIPMNANSNTLDAFSVTVLKLTTATPQTMSGQLIVPSLIDSGLGSSTNVICPNGTGGALTTVGCTVPTGFPIVLGTTSIAGFSTTTTVNGLTLTSATADGTFTGTFNGVNLSNSGSTSLFLNQAGGYSTPAGGGSGTVTQVNTGAGLTGGPINVTGTISIANGGVTNAMLVNSSMTLNGTLCGLGSTCTLTPSNVSGGALGSVLYQSAPSTTAFLASPTTSGHQFVLGWAPSGSAIAPTAVDLGTFLGTNVTGSSPIVVTPSTLGVSVSCPTCGTAGGGTSVGVNGGSTLGTLNINAISPVADANFLALTPKISGADMIIEAPYGSSSGFGVVKVDGTTITAAAGVISSVTGLSGMTTGQLAVAGSATTITSSIAIGNTGSDIPQLSAGLLNAAIIPNNAANTSGTAANLSGTPTLPNGTAAVTQSVGDASSKIATDAFVMANVGSLSGMTSGQLAVAGSANSITSSIAIGNTGTNIPRLSGGLLASAIIPNNAANTTGNAAALAGGALGSVPYQTAINTTGFVASPTTSGHQFVLGWTPTGAIIAPTALDLGTYLGTNITASSPIVATPSTLGVSFSCPTCGSSSGGTAVGVNGGGSLASLNINAISPVADANFLALTPKVSGADLIIEAPYGSSSSFGVIKCGSGTTCTAGVISASVASLSFASVTGATNTGQSLLVGNGSSLGPTGTGTITATSAPYAGLTGTVPTWNQNTTGTAANLSGTPTLPNGTSGFTQSVGDNTAKLATDAFVQANAVHTICSGTLNLPTTAISSGSYALATAVTCTGLLSTDNIVLDFNGSPLGITGYMPTSTGALLTIYKWPTANTINVAVGNSSASSITPGSATLNYHVFR